MMSAAVVIGALRVKDETVLKDVYSKVKKDL